MARSSTSLASDITAAPIRPSAESLSRQRISRSIILRSSSRCVSYAYEQLLRPDDHGRRTTKCCVSINGDELAGPLLRLCDYCLVLLYDYGSRSNRVSWPGWCDDKPWSAKFQSCIILTCSCTSFVSH